jgi:4-hydroxybenzoate polyprenyltransferase
LSLVVVAAYPFMKRVMGVPQLVLGLAFSWGALVGWSAMTGSLALAPVLLYGAAVAWTVGYDTIYALQDLEDDAVVGIRSSARTFGDHAVAAIAGCYALAVALVALAVWWAGGGAIAFLGVAAFAAHLAWQALRTIGTDGQRALRLFRSNRDAGLLLTAGLLMAAFAGWLA